MASYCTAADVRAALTPEAVSNDGETAASLKDWQLDDAIDEAEDIVNLYTSDYEIELQTISEVGDGDPNASALPFQVAMDPIRRWTRSIAAYYGALTFRKNKDLPEDDPIRLRYTAVMGFLALVKSGEMVLNLPPNTGAADGRVAIFNLYEGVMFALEDFNLTGSGPGTTMRIRRNDLSI